MFRLHSSLQLWYLLGALPRLGGGRGPEVHLEGMWGSQGLLPSRAEAQGSEGGARGVLQGRVCVRKVLIFLTVLSGRELLFSFKLIKSITVGAPGGAQSVDRLPSA